MHRSLSVLFRRKRLVLAVFLSILVAAIILAITSTPLYQANAKLMVRFGREHVYRPEVGQEAVVNFNQEDALNSAISIMMSRDNLEKALDGVGMARLYPALSRRELHRNASRERALTAMTKNITVDATKKSSVFNVAFRHESPEVAARAVQLLIENFRERYLQVYGGTKSPFFETQLKETQKALRLSERRLEAYKHRHKIFSLEEQRTLLLNQRAALDDDLKETRNKSDESATKAKEFQAQMGALLSDVKRYTQSDRDKIIIDARAKLLGLRIEEQSLASKYPERNRTLENVRREIQLVEKFLATEEPAIGKAVMKANPSYQAAEREATRAVAEERALRARSQTIETQLRQLDDELQRIDRLERELRELRREVATHERNLQVYREKTEENRILDEMTRQKIANINVIENVSVPTRPYRPRSEIILVLGGILGLCTALAVGFLGDWISPWFSDGEDIERNLGLPVLGVVPVVAGQGMGLPTPSELAARSV